MMSLHLTTLGSTHSNSEGWRAGLEVQAFGKSTHCRENAKGVCKQMLKKTSDTSSQHPEACVVSRKVTRRRKSGNILGVKHLIKD